MTDGIIILPVRAVRAFVEMENGGFVRSRSVTSAEVAQSALLVVKMQLKETLHGLSPLFTKEALLSLCSEVMEEDENPGEPQTKLYSAHCEEKMSERSK